jgi:hypothetical protein
MLLPLQNVCQDPEKQRDKQRDKERRTGEEERMRVKRIEIRFSITPSSISFHSLSFFLCTSKSHRDDFGVLKPSRDSKTLFGGMNE